MRDATEDLQRARLDVPLDRIAELAPQLYAIVPLDLSAETGGQPVPAYANHGRWVVMCPDCYNAQLTHPADKRFLCNVCGNVGNGRLFRPVTWPVDRVKISTLLDARADPALRNWSPGETVADLRSENEILAGGDPTFLGPEWAQPRWEGHTHKRPKKGGPCRECGHVDESGDR